MKIYVRALANLRHYAADKKEDQMLTIAENDLDNGRCTVRTILQRLGIPESEIWKVVAAANSKVVKKDFVLADGDRLIIYPISAGG